MFFVYDCCEIFLMNTICVDLLFTKLSCNVFGVSAVNLVNRRAYLEMRQLRQSAAFQSDTSE